MSDRLTKKLRRAATLQHMNGTPNATPSTIPQSFWPPDPCCQLIATAVAKRKAIDVPLNTTPRIAAFFAVHSLTETWYGRMVGETKPQRSKPTHSVRISRCNLEFFQRSSQLLRSAPKFPRIHRRKPQHNPIPPRSAVSIPAQRNHFDIVLRGSLRRPLGQDSALQPTHCSQSCLYRRNLQQSHEPLASRFHQHRQALGIQLPHPPNVPRKVTFADEIAQYCLIDQRRMMCAHRLRRRKNLHHVRRNHQVRKPQSREENVSETAGEDYDRGPIQTLQRRDGPSGITIFAVVVIFKDDRAGPPRPFEQRQPATQAHSYAQRELMRRSHINQPKTRLSRLLPLSSASVEIQAFGIHWHRTNFRSHRAEDDRSTGISRFLHPHRIARIQQQARRPIKRLLHTRDDQNLIRRTLHAPRGIQVFRHGFAKRTISERFPSSE